MSGSSISVGRELYGILGTIPSSGRIRSAWDAYFKKNKIDACLTKYPTTVDTLPERLSEMFHFDRRAYLVGEGLQDAITPLLDKLDSSVKNGKVNVVKNEGGVFTGMWVEEANSVEKMVDLIYN